MKKKKKSPKFYVTHRLCCTPYRYAHISFAENESLQKSDKEFLFNIIEVDHSHFWTF